MPSLICHFIIHDMTSEAFVFVVGALSHNEILWGIIKKGDYSFKLFLSKSADI